MASKILLIVLLATVVSQGYAVSLTEVTLPDEHVHFISHPFYTRIISIPKWWFETLLTCHLVLPNGVEFEVYPNNNLSHEELVYASAVEPFNNCNVGFKHSDRIEQFAGSYQLKSLILNSDGQSMTLTTQRFQVSIQVSEVEMPQ